MYVTRDIKDSYFIRAKRLSNVEVIEHIKKIKEQKEEHRRIIILEAFYGRALMLIGKYHENVRMGHDDMLQVAMLSINKCIDKYDVECGYTFYTYCSRSIFNDISRELIKVNTTVKLPANVNDACLHFIKKFRAKYGIEPTMKDMYSIVERGDIYLFIKSYVPIDHFIIGFRIFHNEHVFDCTSQPNGLQEYFFDEAIDIENEVEEKDVVSVVHKLISENFCRSYADIYCAYLGNKQSSLSWLQSMFSIPRVKLIDIFTKVENFIKSSDIIKDLVV